MSESLQARWRRDAALKRVFHTAILALPTAGTLIVTGSAADRMTAAQRFSQAAGLIVEALDEFQAQNGSVEPPVHSQLRDASGLRVLLFVIDSLTR